MTNIEQIPQEDIVLPGENNRHNITPFFKYLTVEDVPQSEIHGKPIYKTIEAVELRIAGDRQYTPVVPANSMYAKDGNRIITYAERFSKQYRAFISGAAQEADGTPLESLTDYGITPAQLSLCRALQIYTVEALHGLEGARVKALHMHGNDLKAMARRWIEDRDGKSGMSAQMSAMEAELAQLRAQLAAKNDPDAVSVSGVSDTDLENKSTDDLKDLIAGLQGARPRGNPSRETLLAMLSELQAKKAE